LSKIVLRAVSACADNGKAPCSFAAGSVFWVRAHADQLTSVVTHMIQNAQDAMTRGGVVAVSLGEGPDGRAVIEIRDTGKGMSEEFVRRKLFKPFETTKGSSGMGIGAYQAREVVRELGGELTVASEAGKGTIVRIILPHERSPVEHLVVASAADRADPRA
jgi:signal transduction histidine kinase